MRKKKKIGYAVGVLFLFIIGFYYVSNYGNSLFGSWAQQTFISSFDDPQTGQMIMEFNWPAFKFFFQLLAILSICGMSITLTLVLRYAKRKQEKDTVASISKKNPKIYGK